MEQVFFAKVPCGTQTIRYYLLEEDRTDEFFTDGESRTGETNHTTGTDYGLLVAMGEEQTAVHALTPTRSRAQDLLERMVRGAVTPVAVLDVVDDWLLE